MRRTCTNFYHSICILVLNSEGRRQKTVKLCLFFCVDAKEEKEEKNPFLYLPMDYPCNVAFDRVPDMMDCIGLESSRLCSFSFYRATDTWTWSYIHRWNLLRVLTPWRRQMALANKFWIVFYFHRNKMKFIRSLSIQSKCLCVRKAPFIKKINS